MGWFSNQDPTSKPDHTRDKGPGRPTGSKDRGPRKPREPKPEER
jgi:hypothetical protein